MTTTTAPEGTVVPALAWKTLACVSLVAFMVSIEITIIALALEDIRAAFEGVSESTLSWVFNGYNITVAALLLPAGWIGDRFGRRMVFCAGVATFALGSLLAGLAPSVEFLIAARVLQAVGGAFQVPAGMALLLSAFPTQKRQLAIGIWGAVGSLATAIGPTLGALIVDLTGWRAVFLFNIPMAIAILLLGPNWLVQADADKSLGRVDLIAVPLASVGVGAMILGIVESNMWGWGSPKTLGAFAVGAVLIAAFLMRSSRHASPLFDLDLFRIRSFSVASLGQTAFVAAFFLWLVPFPTFMRNVWGWSVLEAGFAIAPGPLVAMAVAPLAGRLADRIGPRIPLVAAGLMGTIGVALQVQFVDTEPDYIRVLLIPAVCIGIAAGIGFPGTLGAIVADVGPRQFSMAGAARSTFFQLSLALSIAIAFAIIGRPSTDQDFIDAMQTTWLLAMCLFALEFVLFFVLYPVSEREA